MPLGSLRSHRKWIPREQCELFKRRSLKCPCHVFLTSHDTNHMHITVAQENHLLTQHIIHSQPRQYANNKWPKHIHITLLPQGQTTWLTHISHQPQTLTSPESVAWSSNVMEVMNRAEVHQKESSQSPQTAMLCGMSRPGNCFEA